ERNGDFLVVDPVTNKEENLLTGKVSGSNFASLLTKLGYPAVSGEPYSSVFPAGVIPQKAWSNPAKALLQYVPQPNQGDANFSTSRYNQLLRDNEGALRVDANTDWGALAAYYSLDDFFQDNPYPTGQGGANVPGFNATSLGRAQLFSLGITKALSPNTLNEFHFSYMRFANRVGQPVG